MSFIDDSEKNIKRLMKEVSGGSVGGHAGRAGMGIDALFAGAFHPDSGHGSENEQLLAKQISDRKKQRAGMEKQAAKDGVELVGIPDPIGGHFAEVGETEGIELAYEELLRFNELNKEYSDENTPPQDLEWEEVETDLEYDEPGEAYKIKDIVYDDKPTYAGVNFINQSKANMEKVGIDIKYDELPKYAGDNYINQSQTNWKIIDRG